MSTENNCSFAALVLDYTVCVCVCVVALKATTGIGQSRIGKYSGTLAIIIVAVTDGGHAEAAWTQLSCS